MYCMNCGKALLVKEKFCMTCGAKNESFDENRSVDVSNKEQKEQAVSQTKVEAEKSELKKVFLKAIIGSICVCAVVIILLILTAQFGTIFGKVFSTILAIAWFGMVGWCCINLYERTEYKEWSSLGMIFCIISFVVVILTVWLTSRWTPAISRLVMSCLIISYTIWHCFLILMTRANREYPAISRATNICIIILSFMWLILVFRDSAASGFYYRMLAVVVVLALLGTLVVSILSRMNSGKTA